MRYDPTGREFERKERLPGHPGVPYMFHMSDSRITVTQAELQRAIAIWITTAPKRIWRDYWAHSETIGKWSAGADPSHRFDPRQAMAEFLAQQFERAKWEITYNKPVHPDGTFANDTKPRDD